MENNFYLPRQTEASVLQAAAYQPAVVLVGPRQVGKTSLTHAIRNQIDKPSIYLDLERIAHLNQLNDVVAFADRHRDHLVILDEVQHKPDLFPQLRSVIDEYRQPGRFLLLGSASPDLIRDTSESLAGRVSYLELSPLNYEECRGETDFRTLWSRGGFPRSVLAGDEATSLAWRENFIRTYIERELPRLGFPANPIVSRRLWQMLAHWDGQLLNKQKLANSLDVTTNTVRRYLDFLEQAFLIRRLPPYFVNIGKRLVKSPKVYIRDSGLLHALLAIPDWTSLSGHPIVGASWENFVIEQLVSQRPSWADFYFYRTQNGAEIDLIITKAGLPYAAVEMKNSVRPSVSKGFHSAVADLNVARRFIAAPVETGYSLQSGIEVVGPATLSSVFV